MRTTLRVPEDTGQAWIPVAREQSREAAGPRPERSVTYPLPSLGVDDPFLRRRIEQLQAPGNAQANFQRSKEPIIPMCLVTLGQATTWILGRF
jgi:hypothetical protein